MEEHLFSHEKPLGRSVSRSSNISTAESLTSVNAPIGFTRTSPTPPNRDVCRICQCEGDEDVPLITPCRCTGRLRFVHQVCLQQWMKNSSQFFCDLCKFKFVTGTKLKPLHKWEMLQLTTRECCIKMILATFNIFVIMVFVCLLYFMISHIVEEIEVRSSRPAEGPFGRMIFVVVLILIIGLGFIYTQCMNFIKLCMKLKAHNTVMFVQNWPQNDKMIISDKPVVILSNFEHKERFGPARSDTNSSQCTETVDYSMDVLHVREVHAQPTLREPDDALPSARAQEAQHSTGLSN